MGSRTCYSRLTNPAGFHPQQNNQPHRTMQPNKTEQKIINLCIAAYQGINHSADYRAYNVIARISDAVMELHYDEGIDRDLVVSKVIDKLEWNGVEISY